MIGEAELQELAGYESKESPVLSLYLDTDLTQQPKEKCKLVLRDLLKQVADAASDKDVSRIGTFFDLEYDWQAKGVALFSSVDQGLWRAYPLAVPIDNEIHAGAKFYAKCLVQLLDVYSRYCVVLVDRAKARFFLVHLGQIIDKSEWVGEDVKWHKQGGWSAARYQRHVDKQAEQNLKMAAKTMTRFCKKSACRRIILGGAEDTLVQYREMLPKALQRLVIGTLSVDVTAPAVEVIERSTDLIRAEEQRGTRQLVEDMITATAKGGGAVTGLADTFYAAHEGRIHTLVVEKGLEAEGYLCDGCGYVSAEPTKCPFCGGKPHLVHHAVNRVVHRVVDAGGTMKTVEDNEALVKAGRIGAILRY